MYICTYVYVYLYTHTHTGVQQAQVRGEEFVTRTPRLLHFPAQVNVSCHHVYIWMCKCPAQHTLQHEFVTRTPRLLHFLAQMNGPYDYVYIWTCKCPAQHTLQHEFVTCTPGLLHFPACVHGPMYSYRYASVWRNTHCNTSVYVMDHVCVNFFVRNALLERNS